jgi:hypothetical protein
VNTPGGGSSRNVRRPDVIPGVNPYLDAGRGWINPAAFSIPQAGTFGNSGRNSLTGPGLAQLDLTLSKRFAVTERVNVEFRAEAYNILNHTNFANPANVRLSAGLPSGGTFAGGMVPASQPGRQPGQPFNSSLAGGNFGVLNSTVSNQVGLGTNRQFQLSLRFNF